ncbi:nuclease-related domain-containing protein [Pistricoccus aurantiacus]|uniref:nuclease-related domain-containing protein n=1 Tax=Pistricoccus aurantiacus TaxID=1883414 RepID=UPI00363C4175
MAWLEYLLPLIFLLPLGATAVVVLALRNLHDSRVHSPFDDQLLRESGQTLRVRLDRAFADLFLDGALGPIATLAPMVYGMGRMLFAPRQDWLEWALYGALSTLLALVFCVLLMRDYQRIRRLKLGLACELAVSQKLERLVRPETHPYAVFHDITAGSFTIDHVVLTPRGVFVIETRARTRPLDAAGQEQNRLVVERERLRFPGWSERSPLHKTRQARTWLEAWLARECHIRPSVHAILVLPGWQIDTTEAPKDIQVTNGETLIQTLSDDDVAKESAERLDPETQDRIAHALLRQLNR